MSKGWVLHPFAESELGEEKKIVTTIIVVTKAVVPVLHLDVSGVPWDILFCMRKLRCRDYMIYYLW